jgi:hypothetical protein
VEKSGEGERKAKGAFCYAVATFHITLIAVVRLISELKYVDLSCASELHKSHGVALSRAHIV